MLLPTSEGLEELIIKIHPIIKIFYANAFVFAVSTVIVHVCKNAGDSVSRNTGDAQVFTVACAIVHNWNDGKAAIELAAERFQFADDCRIDSGSGRRDYFPYH